MLEKVTDNRSHIREASAPRRALAVWLALLIAAAIGCNGAGGASDAVPRLPTAALRGQSEVAESPPEQETPVVDAAAAGDLVTRLERLRKRGQFEEFIDAALNASDEHADVAALQLLKAEALLAGGRHEAAELAAQSAAALALDDSDPATSSHALKLWAIARFRQQKALDDPLVADLLTKLPPDEPGARTLRFWSDALGQRTVYRLSGAEDAGRVEIQAARAQPGTVPDELNAIEARVNGMSVPLAFVDTGTQHVLMTVRAAEAAGVAIGPSATHLVGFARLNARPGVIETLELGSLVLHDVPVMVGNSPPLVALKGQMALGTELMHHVRFTIDYPGRRVFAEGAATRLGGRARRPEWEIPLWTFSQACLARGQLPGGAMARVLVDTGNRAGTFVSARWAHRNLPDFQRPPATVIFKFKQRNLWLDEMQLGSGSLYNWPVVDTIPNVLERLDTVDVLLGHDMLAPYEVTIDLEQRVLQLYGHGIVPAARESQNAPRWRLESRPRDED